MTALRMTRGDTRTFTIALTDPAGAPLPLAGLEITFTAKVNKSDEDAYIVKTVGDGVELVEGEEGTATITIDPQDTEDLAINGRKSLPWDVQIEDDSEVRTPLSGRLIISADVNRGRLGS